MLFHTYSVPFTRILPFKASFSPMAFKEKPALFIWCHFGNERPFRLQSGVRVTKVFASRGRTCVCTKRRPSNVYLGIQVKAIKPKSAFRCVLSTTSYFLLPTQLSFTGQDDDHKLPGVPSSLPPPLLDRPGLFGGLIKKSGPRVGEKCLSPTILRYVRTSTTTTTTT